MRLELHTADDLDALAARFPAVAIVRVTAAPPAALTAAAWDADDFDFWAFDRSLDALAAAGAPLAVSGSAALAAQVLTRAQRVAPQRNAATAGAWFDRVLAAHAALHDLARPLVQADLDHARDTWQWTLRRDPAAGAAVQLAALLHDVERLASEADARVEHQAADYQAFKDAHAAAGARTAAALVAAAGVDAALAAETAALIAAHERRSAAPALAAINDADALSFFSLNSPGYLAYFGPEQTARKVAYTLGRMSPAARHELPALRLPAAIRSMIAAHHGHLA